MIQTKQYLADQIKQTEIIALKIKAIQFFNLQTFSNVQNTFEEGEIYEIDGVGYSVITKKTKHQINFIVIVKAGATWKKHWQDVDKSLTIKKGIYKDLFTKKEYTDKVFVPKNTPSYFKAIGDEDLIIKGKVYK